MPAVRKRIIIGAIAGVVLGVLAYLLSQPKKGSVEYHKARYLRASYRESGSDWRSRLARWLAVRTQIPAFLPDQEERAQEVAFHRNALVRLGYLSERMIPFTNTSVEQAFSKSFSNLTNWPTEADPRLVDLFFNRLGEQTNAVVVIAPTSSIQSWEDYLRKFDVPEGVR
jgi:hypothetical protein